MNRRLNPDLFGPSGASTEPAESSYSVVATRKVENSLKATNKRLSHLESLLEVVQSQMTAMASNNERRTDAFSKALSELERDLRDQNLTTSRSLEKVEQRFREQKIKDGQTELMVDRFNNALMEFENKLASLKKVISEKEMTLLTYRKVMEQIVDEVERLKNRPQRPSL